MLEDLCRHWKAFSSYRCVLVRSTVTRIDRCSASRDAAVTIPGTSFRLGVDAIIGLVPGIGDLLGAAISLYIVQEAKRLGVPWSVRTHMLYNVAIDSSLGMVPVAGDLFDAAFRANMKNVALLRKYLLQSGRLGTGVLVDARP
jgi:hypothetical protein